MGKISVGLKKFKKLVEEKKNETNKPNAALLKDGCCERGLICLKRFQRKDCSLPLNDKIQISLSRTIVYIVQFLELDLEMKEKANKKDWDEKKRIENEVSYMKFTQNKANDQP